MLLYHPVNRQGPIIISRSQHTVSRRWISPNALRVLYRLKERGHLAYLVGGGVRDLLLGREPKDFDIATDATPGQIKRIFRNCRLIGRRFRLAHIHFKDEIIEVATFRSPLQEEPEEVLPEAGEQPDTPAPDAVPVERTLVSAPPQGTVAPEAAVEPRSRPKPPRMLKTDDGMLLRDNVFGTPEQDAVRRDFTVNALFYDITDYSVIDYVGGMKDLRNGLIRIIGDPLVRFTEDPVRMVRAVRFAAMLGFSIEERTHAAMQELKDRIALASPARMYEEVQKLFFLGAGEKTYHLLRATGIFGVLLPRINDWLEMEGEGFPHVRVGKALEWVDACIQAGRTVEPSLLFALMFGQYIEEKADALRKLGAPPLEALDRSVAEFMGEHTPRVQIPRKVGLAMRDILWNQGRFAKRTGRHPFYFLRRPGFLDAFEYFRFSSELSGENTELRGWWKEFIKSNPAEAGDGRRSAPGKDRPKKRPPRKRRKRKFSSERPRVRDTAKKPTG